MTWLCLGHRICASNPTAGRLLSRALCGCVCQTAPHAAADRDSRFAGLILVAARDCVQLRTAAAPAQAPAFGGRAPPTAVHSCSCARGFRFTHTPRRRDIKLRVKLRVKLCVKLCARVCRLPPDQRKIPLSTIAARTKLDVDGVEFLLMRAMSLRLVTGTIDEIESTVDVRHVAPRVLTPAEIAGLKVHVESWMAKVDGASALLEAEGGEHDRGDRVRGRLRCALRCNMCARAARGVASGVHALLAGGRRHGPAEARDAAAARCGAG